MRPADSWRDYELLDATNHNRLERWGQTLLIRPDPQVIWKNDETSPLWARADAVYYRSAKGGGQWNYHKRLPQKWQIHWGELTLIVSPTGFKHTGVFPEQAAPAAGSWTTVSSSCSGRSAAAASTTPSSWIRPAMAAAPAVRSGSWRTTSTTSSP